MDKIKDFTMVFKKSVEWTNVLSHYSLIFEEDFGKISVSCQFSFIL